MLKAILFFVVFINVQAAVTDNATTLYYHLSIAPFEIMESPKLAFNQQIPGPLLTVTVGDWLNIQICNNASQPTTVHFHGMPMKNTPWADGVPGVTQCPIPPGTCYVLIFCAEISGTFWYHAHVDLQTMDGLYGPFLVYPISGPPDDGTLDFMVVISAFFQLSSDQIWEEYYRPHYLGGGRTPVPDGIMVNDQLAPCALSFPDGAGNPNFVRLHFINAGALGFWNITSLSGFQVLEIDGTRIRPLNVSFIMLNTAQRVVVLFSLESALSDFDIQVMPSLFHDTGTGNLLPSYHVQLPKGYATVEDRPHFLIAPDLNFLVAEPIDDEGVIVPVPEPTFSLNWFADFTDQTTGPWNLYLPRINGQTFPTSDLENNPAPLSWFVTSSPSYPVLHVPTNSVIEITIKVQETSEHPIHLHTRRFWIVESSDQPNVQGMVIRDTVSVPIEGWVKIRYIANQTNFYSLHCHIDPHMMAGFFSIIQEGEPQAISPPFEYHAMCRAASSFFIPFWWVEFGFVFLSVLY
jgi:FtsP/CotA-like multicopper oxidase with cupredoxin domain